jgi:hypothetical protein
MLKRFKRTRARKQPLPRIAVCTMPSPDWLRRSRHPIARIDGGFATTIDTGSRNVPNHTEETR